MIPAELEARNEVLFQKLVPSSGKAETLEGETLRAINRILYRYYNDGDYWYEGYGTETAGPAEAFLRCDGCIDVRKELKASDGAEGEVYEKALAVALEKILTDIEGKTEYTPNHLDMLDCKSKYEDDSEEDAY